MDWVSRARHVHKTPSTISVPLSIHSGALSGSTSDTAGVSSVSSRNGIGHALSATPVAFCHTSAIELRMPFRSESVRDA